MESVLSSETHQLVDDCLANHPLGMVRLVRRFRGSVFGLCFRMLGQWQDAEDAAQETFWRVSRSLSTWDRSRAFEPWLLAIAANRCRSHLAKRQRQLQPRSLDDVSIGDVNRDTDMAVLLDEFHASLHDLPDDWQMAFRLFHMDCLSYDEIAERLGRPVGTVKTWVHRSRRSLVESLKRRKVFLP